MPLAGGCFPGPVKELWPPGPGEPRYAIDLLYFDWHTLVTFPVETSTGHDDAGTAREPRYTEWGFAEKAWYLDGRQGLTGVARALLWPTESAVGRRERDRPYWERYPERQVERWTYHVSGRGLERLRAYLESQAGPTLPDYPEWTAGTTPYCFTYLCHHFVLEALREAGLPVAPWWGYTAWMTRIQLDRVLEFQAAAGLPAARPDITPVP